MSPSDELFVRAAADRLYGNGQPIWDSADRWNAYKRYAICDFSVRNASKLIDRAPNILDAGCGSERYNWIPDRAICLDRYFAQVYDRSCPIVGDICCLPFDSCSIDFVVCVASVLNYVSAVEAISEFSRVLRPGGHLLLHYETSTSFEHLLKREWGASAVRTDTINSGRPDTIWVYRPSFINKALSKMNFEPKKQTRFHIASAMSLRLGFNQQVSARLAAFDPLIRIFGMFADDVIILAERHA